jgi:hypothetical protein
MAQLSRDNRRQFELAGVAEAWLRHPAGYPRELKAALCALEDEETPMKVFHVFLGKLIGTSGLLFLTDKRLIFARRRRSRQDIISIPYATIARAYLLQTARNIDLKIETDSGERFGFWPGGSRDDFLNLVDGLKEQIGERLLENCNA